MDLHLLVPLPEGATGTSGRIAPSKGMSLPYRIARSIADICFMSVDTNDGVLVK
jgi:hypothetical protein